MAYLEDKVEDHTAIILAVRASIREVREEMVQRSAHAQATGFHTILCASDVELEPDSDQLVSSCTIAPAQAGIGSCTQRYFWGVPA